MLLDICHRMSQAPPPPTPFTASFFSRDTFSHVAAFPTPIKRASLVAFIKSLHGTLEGNWWVLPNKKAVDEVVKRTQTLGGISYYLLVDGFVDLDGTVSYYT